MPDEFVTPCTNNDYLILLLPQMFEIMSTFLFYVILVAAVL